MSQTLFESHRARYSSYMERVDAWERTASARLRAEILVPYFGGCGCRMHNCRVNYETGNWEYPVHGKSHADLARMAREFDYRQRVIWDTATRLREAFWAKYLSI